MQHNFNGQGFDLRNLQARAGGRIYNGLPLYVPYGDMRPPVYQQGLGVMPTAYGPVDPYIGYMHVPQPAAYLTSPHGYYGHGFRASPPHPGYAHRLHFNQVDERYLQRFWPVQDEVRDPQTFQDSPLDLAPTDIPSQHNNAVIHPPAGPSPTKLRTEERVKTDADVDTDSLIDVENDMIPNDIEGAEADEKSLSGQKLERFGNGNSEFKEEPEASISPKPHESLEEAFLAASNDNAYGEIISAQEVHDELESSSDETGNDTTTNKKSALKPKSEEFYRSVYRYLKYGTYPASVKDKSNFRKQCKRAFKVEGNHLLHKTHRGKDTIQGRDHENFPAYAKVVTDKKQQAHLVKLAHEGADSSLQATALSGHRGEKTTTDILSRRVWWPRIAEDVKAYVQSCDTCQRVNQATLKAKDELHPVPPPRQNLKQIGVDLITMPEVDGFHYVAVAIDYLSKFCHAKALMTKKTVEVAQFLFDWICLFSCPKIIINDQGGEFCSRVSEELCRLTGVQQRVTAAYNPQANGLVERQNHTMKCRFLKVLRENIEEWPSTVDAVLFGIRTQRQRSTGYSPFFLLFGQEPVLPLEMAFEPRSEETEAQPETETKELDIDEFLQEYSQDEEELKEEVALTKFVQTWMSHRKTVLSKARRNIKNAQREQKIVYDKRHSKGAVFKVGDMVMKANLRRRDRKGDWIQDPWSGPYEIVDIDGNKGHKLMNKRGHILVKAQRARNLRHYKERINESDAESCNNSAKEDDPTPRDGNSSSSSDSEEGADVPPSPKPEVHPADLPAAPKPEVPPADLPPAPKPEVPQPDVPPVPKPDMPPAPEPDVPPPSKPDEQPVETPANEKTSQLNPLPPLRNGNTCKPVNLALCRGRPVILYNTCCIDALTHILADAIRMSEDYLTNLKGKNNEVVQLVQTVANEGPSELAYLSRTCVLFLFFGPLKIPKGNGKIQINCNVNASALVEKLFSQQPTAEQVKTCDGKSCPNRVQTLHRPFISLKIDVAGMPNNLQTRLQEWADRTSQGKCLLRACGVGDGLIFFDKALRCNGRTFTRPVFSSQRHLFIELIDDNAEKLIECTISLQQLPPYVVVDNVNYALRGVMEFIGGRVATRSSMGHYRANVLLNGNWVCYDDLNSHVNAPSTTDPIRVHIVVCTI